MLVMKDKRIISFLICDDSDQVESYKTEELRFNERSQLHLDLQDEYNLAISKSTLEIKATKKFKFTHLIFSMNENSRYL